MSQNDSRAVLRKTDGCGKVKVREWFMKEEDYSGEFGVYMDVPTIPRVQPQTKYCALTASTPSTGAPIV